MIPERRTNGFLNAFRSLLDATQGAVLRLHVSLHRSAPWRPGPVFGHEWGVQPGGSVLFGLNANLG